ncbi:MAG: dihydrofolate reductase [Bacteroidetes bacterium]|nr:dihydrofolate reductase [Bacteroidota bacterium]
MAKLSVFNFMTLNGFYKGADDGIQWHRHGAEESDYAKQGANSGSTLLFGRRTYEMMASFWPTPMAAQMQPEMAKGMNASPKIVFSRTLQHAAWQNTRIVATDPAGEIQRLKKEGKNMTILGSGSIVTLCAEHGLVDEYKFMIDPVLIGNGTPVARTLSRTVDLVLISTRAFSSGVVLLTYAPAS